MRYLIGLLAIGLLVACDDKPPKRTVFDGQLKAIEKARGVEGQLRESAERRADETARATDKVDTD